MGLSRSASKGRRVAKPRSVKPPRNTGDGVKVWPTSEDAPCLTYEYLLMFLRTGPKVKNATVEGLCGTSKIKVAPLYVWIGRIEKVWADIVTGTLYTINGACLSSSKRRVVSKL
jgi:hypothetical protein